jgi:hypothetical protein
LSLRSVLIDFLNIGIVDLKEPSGITLLLEFSNEILESSARGCATE